MGMPIVAGRNFNDADRTNSVLVAIVSKSFARAMWGTENPLGRRFRLGGRDSAWMNVVGVVNDIRSRGFGDTPEPTMYFPHAQAAQSSYYVPKSMSLIVRTVGEPTAVIKAVRAQVRTLDASAPVSNILTLEQVVGISTENRRFTTALIAAFAALALLLAGMGIYGVISYAVSERRFEIGVRMALGADRGAVIGLVLGDGARLAFVGIAFGIAGAVAVGRLLQSMLVDVPVFDARTLVVVSVLLGVVALAASGIPALRASSVNPTDALRGG
jgi:predicted permease